MTYFDSKIEIKMQGLNPVNYMSIICLDLMDFPFVYCKYNLKIQDRN